MKEQIQGFQKLFSGYLFKLVEYLCKGSPKMRTKNCKNYISILAFVTLPELTTEFTTFKLAIFNYEVKKEKDQNNQTKTRWEFASKPSERPTHS